MARNLPAAGGERSTSGFAWFAPVSSLLATHVYSALPPEGLNNLHWFGFWSHMVIFLGFGCYIPVSKHMHLERAGPNIYFHKKGPLGLPQPIDFEVAEKYGTDKVNEYSWKTLLDTFACTECGRCDAVCPATVTDPASALMSPATMEIVVVLPAPLGPSRP